MKISQKIDYACRALTYLARRHDRDQLFRTEDISKEEDIPPQFLSLIFHDLKKLGFLTSKRGKSGGWRLSQDPRHTTLLQVVQALEPDFLHYANESNGSSHPTVKKCWQDLAAIVQEHLTTITLEDLTKSSAETMYYI